MKPEEVVAHFLANCFYYANWPASATNASQNLPARIGLLGKDNLGSYLEIATKEYTKITHRDFEIVRAVKAEDLDQCPVIFIASTKPAEAAAATGKFKGRPVILVSECEDFLSMGGTIQLNTRLPKLAFYVNLDHLQETKITLHPRLLNKASEILRDGKRESIKAREQ